MGRVPRRHCLFAASALLAALLIPQLDVHAQQAGRGYRVGVPFAGGSDTMGPRRDALRKELVRQGFIGGRNLTMIWRAGGEGQRQVRVLPIQVRKLPTVLGQTQ